MNIYLGILTLSYWSLGFELFGFQLNQFVLVDGIQVFGSVQYFLFVQTLMPLLWFFQKPNSEMMR